MLSRGFTQHEMLDSFCLANMNARLYDPGLGLFISADSMVPNPYDFTGFQRYSYVGNGPLSAIDPSGHWVQYYTDAPSASNLRVDESVDVFGQRDPCFFGGCGGFGGYGLNNGSGNFTGGGGGGGGSGGTASGDQNCPKAPGQTQCETVVVTAPPPELAMMPVFPVLFDGTNPNKTQCMKGPRISIGGSFSGTLFALVLGGSSGGSGSLSVPISSLFNFNLNGLQFTGTASATFLAGFGGFAGYGPSGGIGFPLGASPDGVHTSTSHTLQFGAGDGAGVEVIGERESSNYSGGGGPRGAFGAYGAFGWNFSKNYTLTLIGC